MTKKISQLIELNEIKGEAVGPGFCPIKIGQSHRVNIVALGDVGRSVMMGMKLLGGDVISEIGIFDLDGNNVRRLEKEGNQIRYPFRDGIMPKITMVKEEKLFDCDVFVFCATKSVPPVEVKGDVRMAQLEANRKIVEHYGKLAKDSEFKGLICVVSDPVDPLCRAILDASGLEPCQVKGYGLGVMNARAEYYAEQSSEHARYLTEGRAFGPHGADLVIADSIEDYNHKESLELTEKVVTANLAIRDLGFKPYLAPAMSSAAISIILTLRGHWHYSSLYIGTREDGAFLGVKNIMTDRGNIYEDLPLDDKLFERINKAYNNLRRIK